MWSEAGVTLTPLFPSRAAPYSSANPLGASTETTCGQATTKLGLFQRFPGFAACGKYRIDLIWHSIEPGFTQSIHNDVSTIKPP